MPFSTVPFIFSPNTLIQSAQVNADFASVVEDGNNIDASQITTGVLPVDHGGTGVTTPGEITTSIGAVAKAGDTMTGNLTVPNITYSGFPGQTWAFNWDGTNAHVIVNGIDTGIIGDITSITASNGITTAGLSGAVTVAMSGSYSGTFNATNLAASGNITGSALGIAGNTSVGGNLSVDNQITCHRFYSSGDYAAGDWKLYVTNEVWCGRHFVPAMDGGVYCGLAAYAWAGVYSYAFVTASDPALKRDIAPVPPGCLGLVNAIEPKTYKLKLEADEGRTHWGFLAPEIGEAMRHAGFKFDGVRTEGDAPASLAYNELIAVLWSAVQELTARVKTLEAADGAA